MRKVKSEEVGILIDEGCGYLHFMGGSTSKNGKEIIDSSIGLWLFEKDEIGCAFFKQCMDAQERDAIEYLDKITW